MLEENQFLSILRAQVKPAFGCTEPVACTLAVTRAREVLGKIDCIDSIKIVCSPSVYKNGFSVGIPGTDERGMAIAAALGVFIGHFELGLEVLSTITSASVQKAKNLVKQGRVEVTFDPEKSGVFVEAMVTKGQDFAKVIISGSHTTVTYIEKNGKAIYGTLVDSGVISTKKATTNVESIRYSDLNNIIDFIQTVPINKINFLIEGAHMNMKAAKRGLAINAGHGVGKALETMVKQKLLAADMSTKARIYTAAATDARMGGVPIMIMSSAGSGNHGIGATIPVTVVWKELEYPEEKLARSLALSHLITVYIKEHMGRLSPMCGCSVAAGAGSAAACAWLLNGGKDAIERAIQNIIANLAGMFCDGGKNGCAFKIASTAAESILAAELAIRGISADYHDGIVGKTVEQTIANMGYVSIHGLRYTDTAILAVMQNKSRL